MNIRRTICLTLISVASLASSNSVVLAQRGQLIEGLFRTLAETHLERERAKIAEAQQLAKERAAANTRPAENPYQVQLPSGFGNSRPSASRPGNPNPTDALNSINVRSREAADFVRNLAQFNTQMLPLVNDLRMAANQNATIRNLLPSAYSVSADGRALLQSCNGLTSLQPVVNGYGEIDARWRQLSFALRNIDGLSERCSTAITRCDELCGSMTKQLNIEPQFNRRALHDVMMTASALMLALEDDLQIVVRSEQDCRVLCHDLRLFRQRLIREAEYVEKVSYSDIVEHFNEFAVNWRGFASRVYRYNNPHVHRRLDRISECGEQTYRLLWMTPPASQFDVSGAVHRIEHGLEDILDQLTIRSMIQLSPAEQVRLLESCQTLNQQADALLKLCDRNANLDQIREQFLPLERGWAQVQAPFRKINGLNRGILDEINRACQEIRTAVGGTGAGQVTAATLLQSAAALEGTSEYLRDEIRKMERFLKPNSFRDSTRSAVNEFYDHSRRLHDLLDRSYGLGDQRHLEKLQREAEHLLEGWEELAKNLQTIEAHGISRAQAQQLRRVQREVVPHVAQIAAALLQ